MKRQGENWAPTLDTRQLFRVPQ